MRINVGKEPRCESCVVISAQDAPFKYRVIFCVFQGSLYMQQPDHLASVNNCPTNSHTMAQQSNNNFNNGSSASMQGLSANTNQLTLSNKSNFNKGGLIHYTTCGFSTYMKSNPVLWRAQFFTSHAAARLSSGFCWGWRGLCKQSLRNLLL